MTNPSHKAKGRKLRLVGASVLVLAVAVAVSGIASRAHNKTELAHQTTDLAIPTVAVVSPRTGEGVQDMVLPGTIDAYYEASIHARVGGYLKDWRQDIGAHVKAGQLLAEIDAPELDQELVRARADYATAQANAALAALTARRWQALQGTESVSQQSIDEHSAEAEAKKAAAFAAKANLDRLQALIGFKRIVAPFAAVVTARKTDIGDLITPASGQELFSVADTHEMRIYVHVPQAMSAMLTPGMTVLVRLPQYPHRDFKAHLDTTSNAVDRASRSLLVELLAPNADGLLWPGTYGEVHFRLPADKNVLQVPSSALLFRRHGTELAVVDAHDRIHLKPVELGRDFGTIIEIRSGLSASDRVVDNPSDSIAEGDQVRVAAAKQDGRS